MQIEHHHSDARGKFLIPSDEGKPLAQLVYTRKEPATLVAEHTEVQPQLRGQNIGNQLVESFVEYARQNGLKIQPLCPFVKSVMERMPEYEDVYMR